MRKLITGVVLLFVSIIVEAQQYGAQWVFGLDPAVLDFRNDTVSNWIITNPFGITLTVADICDENGNLLYATNGIFIRDSSGNGLQNDTGLSPCPYTTQYMYEGLNFRQAALFIPKPGDSRYYYLFHYSADDSVNIGRPATLYYSIIDKEGNGGLGSVVRENIVFCTGRFRGGGMTACKHANGRDYWLIQGEYNTNRFFEFLVTPDSILGPYIQAIGPVFAGGEDLAYSKFTQDGSKYATITLESLALIMDFDRCNGEFSNPSTIFNYAAQEISGGTSLEFSPNNRFLYIADNIDMNQYDLFSTNGQDSVKLYLEKDTDYTGMDFMQLGPNGKLYCTTWDGGYYFFDVVNSPDQKGDSCNFVLRGQPTLSINSNNLPNMINYALGSLAGSACDTITGVGQLTQDTKQLRIHPNPANKYAYVEMPMQGSYELRLMNDVGQLIAQRQTPQIDIFDTEALPAGVYFILATDKQTGKQLAAQKVVVVH